MSSGANEEDPGFSGFKAESDARFAALESAVKAKFDRIDRRLRELSVKQELSGESAAAQAGSLERLEDGLDALGAREEISARKLKEALERLAGLEENFASMDKLKAGISEIREALENTPVSAEELRFCVRKMGVIEAAFTGFSGKLARQEKNQASTASSIGDLENKLEYLTVILNRLREMVGKTMQSPSK
ncbi:MAG: hypothetical protein A2X28_02870 [Elusimicrobia bacterium GWA2_56_46]|nr:MAG: hypothetical protein A2X28_02870 [Elusimicrobia bacterium GWA2_56_46]OGR54171.1 MAG: hypothetical protein A2X39_08815 [Elusimicrobia bacterium GWC2_56_31]HBB67932.1 hypothetical protein [Elusimicrobiota bacterium]HBW21748.1 hypothetical protein [Elusimicrobiota bacterium]